MARKIKKDDMVIVRSGRSKGVSGKVLRVLPDARLIVEGVNIIHKHVKPDPNANRQGGIQEKEATIHASNVVLLLPLKKAESTKKWSKAGFKTLEDGRKVRYFKKNGELVDV